MQAFIIASMKKDESLISYGFVLVWLTSVSTKLWDGTDLLLHLEPWLNFWIV